MVFIKFKKALVEGTNFQRKITPFLTHGIEKCSIINPQ